MPNQPPRKSSQGPAKASRPSSSTRRKSSADPEGTVVLLSGGNPQIAKADGETPVRAYIAAMPGWKRSVGEQLDALIVRAVPTVRKAVRWNTPFYGIEGHGWFVAFHCFTKYIKVTFFAGDQLIPAPTIESKSAGVRYFHIHEGDSLDEALLAKWMLQASQLPGDRCF